MNVEAAEFGDRGGDRLLPTRVVRHVERDEAGFRARPGEGFRGRVADVCEYVADHHGGAGFRQGAGHARAETARAASHQRLAASQVENAHQASSMLLTKKRR